MAAGLPVDKWLVLSLLVMNSTVLPPMVVGTGPHPSEKTIRSDKIPALSSEHDLEIRNGAASSSRSQGPFQERASDPWAGDLQAVLVLARSV